MIKVHYLNNSRAQRILFLLEEMGTPYQTEVFLRENGLAPTSLKNIHPLAKSPVITDGELVLTESGAIIEYLAEKYGKDTLVPAGAFDSPDMLAYKYWMHYAEGSLAPALIMQLSFVDNYLSTHEWFAGGSFSAADVQIIFPLEGAARQKGASEDPHISAYVDRVQARPAYLRALDAGEPYAFANKN
jgi:glutathione S-transferase